MEGQLACVWMGQKRNLEGGTTGGNRPEKPEVGAVAGPAEPTEEGAPTEPANLGSGGQGRPDGQQETDSAGWWSVRDIATKYNLNQENLRGRLKRWRHHNAEGWMEVSAPERRPREPKFLDRPDAVKPVIEDMLGSQNVRRKKTSRLKCRVFKHLRKRPASGERPLTTRASDQCVSCEITALAEALAPRVAELLERRFSDRPDGDEGEACARHPHASHFKGNSFPFPRAQLSRPYPPACSEAGLQGRSAQER